MSTLACRTFLAVASLAIALCALASPSAAQSAEPSTGLRRFALVVGINDGGPERVPLRYAGRDAVAFHDVMTQLGGIERPDAMMLDAGDAKSVRAGFRQMAQRVEGARSLGHHTEFLFFYSGHSDEEGLRLGTDLLPYAQLRRLVESVGAEVRVAVLDSCASGTLTRTKGGRRRAPFLFDLSSDVRGHAFLTSASGTEAAQESDRIQASFFTHYLVTGLRGAADFNGDGRVTLNEAYRFAFDETLARTQKTQAGAQHPAYDIQLVGTGDLVMTDLKATTAGLGLPKTVAGRFHIRDAAGHLVAELFKPAGRHVELALPAGEYTVSVETDQRRLEGKVVLAEASTRALSADALQPVDIEATRSRGSAQQPVAASPAEVPAAKSKYRKVPIAGAVFSPIDSNQAARHDGAKIINNAQFNLLWGRTDVIEGVQIGVANHVDERMHGAQLAYALNSSQGPVEGAQLSAAVNLAYGAAGGPARFEGLQATAGVNLLRGDLQGAQLSAGVNGTAGDIEGLQATAGVNVVTGSIDGLQASAGVNYAGRLDGAQLTAGVNYAGELSGLQAAPVNVTLGGAGAGIGIVNVSSGKLAGLQLGVVNYADEADVQLGILSVTREGGVHPQLWTSSTGVAMASLRMDAKYSYSLLHVGSSFADEGRLLGGVGFGFKIPLLADELFLEPDLCAYYVAYRDVAPGDTPRLAQGRLLVRYQLHRHLSFFGGPTFSALWTDDAQGADLDRPGYGGVLKTIAEGEHRVRLWPGFAAGVSF